MTPYPRLIFGPGHDERTRMEMTDRGYVSHVWVQTNENLFYPVFFFDPVRLRQELEEETRLGHPFVAEPGMIILPTVTEKAMMVAVNALYHEGYFETLRPSSLGTQPTTQDSAG